MMDSLAGVSFPDPYRWLEGNDEEVRQWQRAQADLASAHVCEWPHFGQLRELVARCNVAPRAALPRYMAGRWFRMHWPEGAAHAQVLVSEDPMGAGPILFDPRIANPAQPPFVSWISPSPDGAILALGLCRDGSETNTITLIDTASGRSLPGAPAAQLMDNWTGGVHWLPDSSGFFFTAIAGAAADFRQTVYLHRLASSQNPLPVEVSWSREKDWRMVVVSRDGCHAVALEGLTHPIPIAIAKLGKAPPHWRPFVTDLVGTLAGHIVDGQYIAVTDVGARRGRLVAVSLDSDTPNDPASWQELVPESEATLRTVTPVGDTLYLTEFLDTYARVRCVDKQGNVLGEVPMPQRGAVGELPFPLMNLVAKGHPTQYLFAFSSFMSSWAVYRHVSPSGSIELLKDSEIRLADVVVEDNWATSMDGTRVPYHLVRRADVDASTPQPTLVYAYGGFNVPLVPQFPGPMAAVVAAGAVFVHAHLRGGAEFGHTWWQGGRMSQKQNCYDDLYAIAEDLISANRSTANLLALSGGSNGGLMAGVALTQRPELWRVVVPRVPMMDLIGACREAYGRMCIQMEYADVTVPDEVRRLARFSPYHLIQDGMPYPAVFIDAGDTDPRCPPWHARKFAARLQSAVAGTTPVLLHVWENVGHGWASDKAIAVKEHTEWLAFVLRHLNFQWPSEDGKVIWEG